MATQLLRDDLKHLNHSMVALDNEERLPSPENHRAGRVAGEQLIALIKLGIKNELGLFRTLHLLLKAHWEAHVSDRLQWASNNGLIDDSFRNLEFSNSELEMLCATFSIDAGYLYKLFTAAAADLLEGLPVKSFQVLTTECVHARLQLNANNSIEVRTYAANSLQEALLVNSCSAEQEITFWDAKQEWLLELCALENCLENLEQLKISAAYVERDWNRLVGRENLVLIETTLRLDILVEKTRLLEENPGLCELELRQRITKMLEAREREIRQMQETLQCIEHQDHYIVDNMISLDAVQVVEIKKQSKKLLRQIRAVLHPDKLEQHANYHALSEKQCEQLKDLWLEVAEIRIEDLNVDSDSALACRSPCRLADILMRAKIILDYAGIDINVMLLPQGDTYEERLSWYRQQLQLIHSERDHAKAESQAIWENEEQNDKKTILRQSGEVQANFREKLTGQIANLEEVCEEYETRLASLLEEGQRLRESQQTSSESS